MLTLNFTSQITKGRLLKIIRNQPERFFHGNNWEGTVYTQTAQNLRQKDRLITKLAESSGSVTLSRADAQYLYAVIAQSRSRHYTSNEARIGYGVGDPSKTDSTWRAFVNAFKKIGINNFNYQKAWSN